MNPSSQSLQPALRAIFGRYQDTFSGAILIKSGDDTLLSGASGFANRDFAIPNRIDTKFDTASVTKVFTAAACLLLMERGALRPGDGIVDLLGLTGTKIPRDVTIEHLLTHTSGIADDADEEAGEKYEDLFIDKPNYAIRHCADFLPQFAYKDPVFRAGTDVRYNNCAFVLLGLAIEKLTGTDYRAFVTENILRPCGLADTVFLAKDEICPNAAEGYFAAEDADGNFVKWKKNIYSYPPIGTPDGGMYSTVSDLDAFLRAIRAGRLLSEPYAALLLSPRCPRARPSRYGTWRTGYAFEFIERDGQTLSLFKEGENAGVEAMFSYYPALDLTLNILANQSGALWKMHREMRDALVSFGDH